MTAWTGRVVAGLLFAAVVCVPATAGQGQRWQGEQRARGAGGELSVQEIQREIDRFEIVEARRALGLDEQAFAVVGQRMQRIQAMRRRHQNQRMAILNDLRRALEAGPTAIDEAAVTARLAELGGLGVRQAQELRRAQQALDAVLTVPQRVQYRFFQERFERRKLDLLMRAQQAGRGRGR